MAAAGRDILALSRGIPLQERAVDGVCAVGGVRAQPAREDLRLFVENVASLDGSRVAELLQAKMVSNTQHFPACANMSSGALGAELPPAKSVRKWHPVCCPVKSAHAIFIDVVHGCDQEANVGMLLQEGSSWQVVLRALHAVEAIVQQGSTAACGEVAVHFQVGLLRPSVQHAPWPSSHSSPSLGSMPFLRIHSVPFGVLVDETQSCGCIWLDPLAQHIQAVTSSHLAHSCDQRRAGRTWII